MQDKFVGINVPSSPKNVSGQSVSQSRGQCEAVCHDITVADALHLVPLSAVRGTIKACYTFPQTFFQR